MLTDLAYRLEMEQSPRPRRWSKPRRTRSRPKMFSKFFQEVLEGSKAPSSDSGVSSWRSDLTQAGSHFESWHALLGLDTLTHSWRSQVRSNKNQHRCGEKFFVQVCSFEEKKTFRHKILVRNFYFFHFLKDVFFTHKLQVFFNAGDCEAKIAQKCNSREGRSLISRSNRQKLWPKRNNKKWPKIN